MQKKTIFNIIALCTAVFCTEVLLQYIPVKVLDQNRPHHQTFCAYDHVLGWWHIPNKKARYVTDEYAVELEFNSQGIRGPEYSFKKPDNVYRVLILGDSFAEGYSAPFSHVFSEYLRRHLEAKLSRPVEVINAGIGGYSTDQELIFYKTRGQQYNPDLTIVLFYFNDVLANSQPGFHRGYKPFFSLGSNNELLLRNVPVPKSAAGAEKAEAGIQPAWMLPRTIGLIKEIVRNLPALPWLNPKKQREDMRVADEGSVHSSGSGVPAEYFVWQKKDNAMTGKSWQMTEAVMRQFKKETESGGSELLIFYVPEKAAVFPGIWNNLKIKYGLNDEFWNVNEDDSRLEAICRKHSIDCFNPLEAYASETNRLSASGKSLFFDIDEHWNIRGQKFTGRLMAEVILQKYFNR